jgi:HEAT repeat protein
VSRNPQLFAAYVPIVTSLIVSMAEEDLEHFRAGALWAIGRLGKLPGGHDGEEVLAAVTSALDNDDSQVRGMAVWCLGQVGKAKLLADRRDLLSDGGPVDLYQNRSVRPTTVREMVEALLAES